MKTKFIPILVLAGVILFSVANPSPVLAALAVTSVNPATVVNSADATITVTGTDFTNTAVVRLDGTALATTYVSATTLTAVVPSGFAAGVYDVQVEVAGVGSATLTDGLTVQVPTATPSPFARPQIVIDTYSTSVSAVSFGQDFNINISLDNAGGSTAYGIQVTFTSADLLMLKNGGVIAVGSLGTVGKANISQSMTAAASLYGRTLVSLDMNVIYYDEKGTSYSEKFTLYIPVAQTQGGGGGSVYYTPTPTGVRRSQLVISDYKTDVDPLQPGALFRLTLTVENVGTLAARGVTMVVGGGSGGSGGTPQPGVSAGSGEFTNFAPVGTSNVKSLGNIDAGTAIEASQDLIVNVSTSPGAYPMKISFIYIDANGTAVTDEQVITLLVYRLPQVEIGFYQPLEPFYAGQPGLLPLQVVNLGRSSVVLGTMTVETPGGTVEGGQILVGALEMGGYFPLDAVFTPFAAGTFDLFVTINYTDDFNQPRTITQTLTVEVYEAPFEPTPDPNVKPEPLPPQSEETFWQKVWRFILGLLGLDSGVSTETPVIEEPTFEPVPIEPLPEGGKG